MFGIGWSELIVIGLALLVFVGPKDLPRLMNRFGRLMRELSQASRDLRNQLDLELRDVPTPKDIVDDLTAETEAIVKGPYAEAKALDEELRREIAEAAPADAALPRFEPKPEPAALPAAAGDPPGDDHAG